MDFYKKLGMYLFSIGALLAVLAGAFPVNTELRDIILIILIVLGVFSSLFNITSDEEYGFLIAGATFLLIILLFKGMENTLFTKLSLFFKYATVFIGSMLSITSLKIIMEYGSQNYEKNPLEDANDISDHMDKLFLTKKEKAWTFIIFLAVATTFVMVLMEVFFKIKNKNLFLFFDWLIVFIFFIDLIVLYKKEKSFKNFLKNCWLDIIATIPFYGFLRVIKVIRLIELMKLVKLNKTLKFFSDKSSVKDYIQNNDKNKTKKRKISIKNKKK